MQGHRVNLTLAEGDYQRLVAAAEADGKTPSTYASDMLKAFLFRPLLKGFGENLQVPKAPLDLSQAPKGADRGPEPDLRTRTLPGVPETPKSRQQLRQEARKAKKAKK